jgi:iron complex outermembrane recepter protein
MVWGNVSRTARAPSRVDRELFIPGVPPHTLAGGPEFRAEIANVYELGYRAQVSPALSYAVTAFHHDHARLRSLEPRPGGAVLENRIAGRTSGVEAWAAWHVAPYWRLHAGWVELRQRLRPEPGSLATVQASGHGNDPRRWGNLRSAIELAPRLELDLIGRYVGALPNPHVPSYTAVDARLGWHATRALELSVHGQNLFDSGHPEWGVVANRVQHRRGVFFKLVWRP